MAVPRSILLCACLCVGFVRAAANSDAKPEPLTTAAAVLSLPAEQAGARLPIAVTGVVTAAEPDWNGQFFVQDATGGVFVENLQAPAPRPGDVVSLRGVSHPGAFAPIISEPVWNVIGTAALPEPRAVSIESLESGVEDGQRIEIAGVVRRARVEADRLNVELAVGGYRLQVRAPVSAAPTPDSLIAARVHVRGTAATHYNAALRHLTAVALYVPRAEDFTIIEPEPGDPFTQPVVALNRVAQYRRESGPSRRVHVRGVVTLQRRGEDIFLQDASGGLRIESAQRDLFPAGTTVDAAGFLEYEAFLPLLRDATLRRSPVAVAPIPARVVPLAEIRNGVHHGEVVTLRGRILDRSTRPMSRAADGTVFVTTWLLQGDALSFTVEYEAPAEDSALAAIPVGSTVRVDGVCLSEIDTAGRAKSIKLLLATPAGLRVLARPSWLTPERLLVSLGLLSTVLVAVVFWLLTVSKKNTALHDTLRKLERARHELQEAHDTLEQKVIERSTQLQVEMTARRAAELQFKAVLAERTRLARDLHDTLEQTLTGIALQLDTSARLFARDRDASSHHLELARNWLHQSQVELRRSIWDLRSRELEQFDLAQALRHSAEHLVAGTAIQLEFTTRGPRRPLPEVVEENVLRIGQEALTNVAKHAQASRVTLALEFTPCALRLRIEDNGTGFAAPAAPAPGDNHFGLLGMSERAKRLGGQLVIDSAVGRGTTVAVAIPLEPCEPDTPALGAPAPAPSLASASSPAPGLEGAPRPA